MADNLINTGSDEFIVHHAGFHFGQVKEVVDHFDQPLGALLDDLKQMFLTAGNFSTDTVEQQIAGFVDGGEGRAEFVGDVGNKIVFHFIYFFKAVGHLAERLGQPGQFAGRVDVELIVKIHLTDVFCHFFDLAEWPTDAARYEES